MSPSQFGSSKRRGQSGWAGVQCRLVRLPLLSVLLLLLLLRMLSGPKNTLLVENGSRDAAQDEPQRGAMTVVIMSHPGTKRLKRLVSTMSTILCEWPRVDNLVHEVLLVWNGPGGTIPDNLRALQEPCGTLDSLAHMDRGHTPSLRILPQTQNKLANRWLIGSFLQTDAVLNLDDDVKLPYASARCAFHVWQSSPSSLVALDVRAVVKCNATQKKCLPSTPFAYAARGRMEDRGLSYNIALPRALISSSVYYIAFSRSYSRVVRLPWGSSTIEESIERIVAELLCDDMAFNFAVANVSDSLERDSRFRTHQGHSFRAAPILVSAPIKSFPEFNSASALTHQNGMKLKRQRCANRLSMLFSRDGGRTPFLLQDRRWHVKCTVVL